MSTDLQQQTIPWRIIPASVAGASHLHQGLPCQDAHYWEILPEGVLIAAVADGAGSAALAEVGSQIAVGAAVETVRKNPQSLTTPPEDEATWHQFLRHTLKAASLSVSAEAVMRDAQVRDLATTLILVIATPTIVAVAQIGDGAVVIKDGQGSLFTLSAPQQGEYINETTFLISDHAVEKAQFKVWQGEIDHLAVFSDGLQLLALEMPDGSPFEPFFKPLFHFVTEAPDEEEARQQLAKFLSSDRVTQRTDDDVTLFLASLIR